MKDAELWGPTPRGKLKNTGQLSDVEISTVFHRNISVYVHCVDVWKPFT